MIIIFGKINKNLFNYQVYLFRFKTKETKTLMIAYLREVG